MVPIKWTINRRGCYYNSTSIFVIGGAIVAKLFSEEEIQELAKNENVISINTRQIIYSNEFKQFFVEEYMGGKGPTMIFESAGLYKNMLGAKRIEKATKRWVTAHKNGTLGVSATLKPNQIKVHAKGISDKEKIKRQDAKIKLLELEVELLKKVDLKERRLVNGSKRITSAEIFEMIRMVVEESCLKNIVSYLCRSAGVSRSGYYNHLSNEEKRIQRESEDLEVRDNILKAFNYRGYKKGSRTIKMLLEDKYNICYNRKRILRIMRKYGIVCPIRRKKYKHKVTKTHRIVPNHLQRKFKQGIPGKILLTDISYLKYAGTQTAYLSTILDAGTNEILCHQVSTSMKLDFVLDTLEGLNKHSFIDYDAAMIHSDQGWHYSNPRFRVRVGKMGMLQSMSRRGNCWDNAPQESFFGHLKDEVEIAACENFEELVASIDDYIDYYNNDRYQSGLEKMTPVKYRHHLLAA